jgi:hypothetical protein
MMNYCEERDLSCRPKPEDRTLAANMNAAWFAFAANPKDPGDGWAPYAAKSAPARLWQEKPMPNSGTNTVNKDTIDIAGAAHCQDIWSNTYPYVSYRSQKSGKR